MRIKYSLLTKVSNSKMAILIDKKVAGLQVTVNNIGRVDVLQPPQYLIQKVADVFLTQLLVRIDNPMEVTFHEVKHNIYVLGKGGKGERKRELNAIMYHHSSPFTQCCGYVSS